MDPSSFRERPAQSLNIRAWNFYCTSSVSIGLCQRKSTTGWRVRPGRTLVPPLFELLLGERREERDKRRWREDETTPWIGELLGECVLVGTFVVSPVFSVSNMLALCVHCILLSSSLLCNDFASVARRFAVCCEYVSASVDRWRIDAITR